MFNIDLFIIRYISLCFLIPIAVAKYRLKLLIGALFFALLGETSAYLWGLKMYDLSTSETFLTILVWIMFLIPIIFFLFVLLSLAENRKQALQITLGYIFVIFYPSSRYIWWIPIILAPVLFILLKKFTILMKERKKSLLLLFLLLPCGLFHICEGWGVGRIFFERKLAREQGYTDLSLFRRHQDESMCRENLQNMRITIKNYYQENGVYPSTINDEIFSTYCYWFTWENIPGKDNGQLIKYLEKECKINWVKTPKIKKSNDGQTITVTDGKNLIELELPKERDHIVDIELNGKVITREHRAKKDGKLRVGASPDGVSCAYLFDHINSERNSEKVILVKTNPNQKIQPSQITDEGGWIYSPDSGDIRINCSHRDSKGVPYYEW